MRIDLDHRWRVDASAEVELPLSATAVWNQMRDWTHFLTIDPLHARVVPRGGSCEFVIQHRFCGFRVDREARLLRWREHRGFAFSDLSRRGVRVGFPHVCSYEVYPLTSDRCRVRVGARPLDRHGHAAMAREAVVVVGDEGHRGASARTLHGAPSPSPASP